MKSKIVKSMIAVTVCLAMLGTVGCGKGGSKETSNNADTKSSKVNLSFAVNFSSSEATTVALQELAKNFQKENPDIHIDVTSLPDYETTMKTKMAANQLPDIFSTHGWSVARYSEYLTPLQDQPWAKNINPLIKPMITDKKNNIFVLPMDVDVAGIAFNKDVLDASGVDPNSIKTWDDFKTACEKIKAKGKIPVYLGGTKDDWTIGNFFDWVAPSFLITNDNKNFRAQLKDGSFDWNNYKSVAELFTDFVKSGYFNKNAQEGTWPEVGEQLAKGNTAFAFFGNYVIGEAKKLNANGNYGFMPIPASTSDDKPSVIAGERAAFGIWKDTKYKKEALKFLEYLAKSENVNKIAACGTNPTGLVGEGYKTDAGKLTEYFDKAKSYRSFGYFDREYLPSGMWDSLCKTGTGLLFNNMNNDQVIQKLKDDYGKLRKQ